MLLLLSVFLGGMLTALAPCILALLPVIIGGSVSGNAQDKKRPVIIAISLAISLILFTLLLKATTLFINIPPDLITYISGAIIVIIGITMLFPSVYTTLTVKLGIEQRSQEMLNKGFSNKRQYIGPIIIGAALGPVFSSCSPVYAYILATILPVNFAQAFVYIITYVLGLTIVLLLIGYFGQRFVSKIKFASNPKGWFQRAIAILFIIIGLMVFTGYDKQFQTYVSRNTPFNFDAISAQLIPGNRADNGQLFNVEEPYDAPEIREINNWINSNPQKLADLKGKVVLIDFWTYSCINCIRSVPYIQGWHETYKNSDFVAIGLHAPEFAFERNPMNVEKAVKEYGLTYPIGLDNDFSTWSAYENRFWPTYYLIDAEGKVRRIHAGEGEYKETEDAIRQLIMENGKQVPNERFTDSNASVPVGEEQTPETYLGTKRASNFKGTPALAAAAESSFTPETDLGINDWTLGGTWATNAEKITARSKSTLTFRVAAKDVYLVAASNQPATVTVMLNGKPISQTSSAGSDIKNSTFTINEAKLYRLVSHNQFEKDSTITLSVPDGVELNVFTFGS